MDYQKLYDQYSKELESIKLKQASLRERVTMSATSLGLDANDANLSEKIDEEIKRINDQLAEAESKIELLLTTLESVKTSQDA